MYEEIIAPAAKVHMAFRLEGRREPANTPAQEACLTDTLTRRLFPAAPSRQGPTRRCISPMRCIPSTRAGPPTAGSARGEHLAVRRGKGRQRVNLAGALCLKTGHCQIVEDLRITAETTVELFARLERANPDKRLIHVILDNAGTNRGRPLRAWLVRPDCRIRPIYCPPTPPTST